MQPARASQLERVAGCSLKPIGRCTFESLLRAIMADIQHTAQKRGLCQPWRKASSLNLHIAGDCIYQDVGLLAVKFACLQVTTKQRMSCRPLLD